MYICVCQGVSDKSLEKLIDEGQNDIKKLMKCSGVGIECGSCIRDIKRLVSESPRTMGKSLRSDQD